MNILFGSAILLLAVLVFSIAFWASRLPRAGAWAEGEAVTTVVGVALTTSLGFGLGQLAVGAVDLGPQLSELGSGRAILVGIAAVAVIAVAAGLIGMGRRNAAAMRVAGAPDHGLWPGGGATPRPANTDAPAHGRRAA